MSEVADRAPASCSHCGFALEVGMHFCPNCGASIGEGASAAPADGSLKRFDSQCRASAGEASTAGAPAHAVGLFEGVTVRGFSPLLVAAAIPIGFVLLIVSLQPTVLKQPELYFAYAFLEATIFLLLFRLFDLYEREPLSILTLMAVWGGTVAIAVAVIGNSALDRSLPRPVDAVFGAAIS